MKIKLPTCFLTVLLFALLSICAGPAICIICNFVVLIGPIACATIVMLILLGLEVYHGMEGLDREE